MTPSFPSRRRLYLMRHGSVEYFLPDGRIARPETVELSPLGRQQADAAGALFVAAGVRFDRVLTSGLARTQETAQRVLAACGAGSSPQATPVIEVDERLQEIRSGRIADLPAHAIRAAFLAVFQPAPAAELEARRFLGGESVGELLDRVLPAWADWLARDDWQCALLVLHGGVNRALLSSLLTGGRAFFGALEQAPACINVLDLPHPSASATSGAPVLRAVNLSPTQGLQANERHSTMEHLLHEFETRIAPLAAPSATLPGAPA